MSSESSNPAPMGDPDRDNLVRSTFHLPRTPRVVMRNARLTEARREEAPRSGGDTAEMGEIERVSALLRSVQPDLEMWHEGVAVRQSGRPSPAWLAIGVVWVSTLLLIGLATGGIVVLVH